MNIQLITEKYGNPLTDKFLDVLYSASVNDLINDLLHYMPENELHEIMMNLFVELSEEG